MDRRCCDGLGQLLGLALCGFDRRQHENHTKLVTAQTAYRIGIAQLRGQRIGNDFQCLVTGGVAVRVIDRLEAIKVEIDQR